MIRFTKFGGILGVLIFGFCLFSFGAQAGYTLYLKSFGEWTVICSLDEPTARKTCVLSAPAPSMPAPAFGPRVQVDIARGKRGGPVVRLHIHHLVDAAKPVVLAVDGHTKHTAQAPRTGDVAWSGHEAGELLNEMTKGKALAVRFFAPGEATARERFFSLAEFTNALATYRETAKRIGAE